MLVTRGLGPGRTLNTFGLGRFANFFAPVIRFTGKVAAGLRTIKIGPHPRDEDCLEVDD